ncbi:MAG: nitroreductase family protein [Candidatus Woesearchaeota archaeon]
MKQAILGRRSIRLFKEDKVPKVKLMELIDMARWAPSACNVQGLKFIIVEDNGIKQKIVDNGGSVVIKNAPQGLLVLYDNKTDNMEYMDHVQSACAAIENLMLYAYSQGIGTCWVNHLPRKKVIRKLFNIPERYEPIAYVLLGYPLRDPAPVHRKYSVNDIVSYDSFGFDDVKEQSVFFRKFLRKIYYLLPVFIKKRVNPYIDKRYVKKFEN